MTEEYSDSPAGTIIEQDPISGDVVPSETVLTFTVSKGLEKLVSRI